MKVLKLIFFCLIISSSTSNILAQEKVNAKHDSTIDKLIPKAQKNKLNEKQIKQLADSYHQANQNNHKRIIELKQSGQADIWMEIYLLLNEIENRQVKIKRLPENIRNAMNFKELRLDNEIAHSKEKAELYLCAKTNLLLEDPTYDNLMDAKKHVRDLAHIINPHNPNIDYFQVKIVILSHKQILLRIATPKGLSLPNDFAELALNFDNNTMYNVPFDVAPVKSKHYDLMLRIKVQEKTISPERLESVTFDEGKGELSAKVTEKTMSKTATIKGQIEFVNIKNEEILISTPFDISSTFVHHYAEIDGNKSACSEQTLKLLESQHIDYPSDEALLKDIARKLNLIIKENYQKK